MKKKVTLTGKQIRTMTKDEKNDRDNAIQRSQLAALNISDLVDEATRAIDDVKCRRDIMKNIATVVRNLYAIKESSTAIDKELDHVITTYL